jgi:F5/8 type C domain/Secretion system C-terminal sorting domain
VAQNVWTQHNDQGRTGWYPYEKILTTSNVNTNTFGLNFSHVTDDKIVAQPLIVMNVNIPNKGFKNVVFVATLNNTIYAYDADVNADAYWQQNYTNKIGVAPNPDCTNCRPATKSDIHPSLCGGSYGDFTGNIGIVSTPVIDTTKGIMYFVTKIVNLNDGIFDNHSYVNNIKDEYNYTTTCFHQYLHAIDITTGLEKPNSPVEITATSNGTGDGQVSPGTIKFDPRRQFNRAGLALSGGMVYIAFAAHCDNNPSHGWVLAYDANSLAQVHSYNPTPNDGRGGTWMSGTAPAVDENGNLYITTGNSLDENRTSTNYNTYTAPATDPTNRGESVIELAPDLTLTSYFTPFNFIALNDADKDFPMQVMLLPNTNLAMTGCKDDSLYIFNKNSLGGFHLYDNNGTVQRVNVQNSASMHSTFGYFGGPTAYAYQYSENSQLKAYPVTAAGLGAAITNTTIAGPTGYMGGFLSSSSNGSDPATGILWAYQAINGCNANGSECHGLLHAVNASNITKELWNSEMNPTDVITVFNKFSCPTIALGKVYLAANRNMLCVYGLKTNTSCLNNIALNKPVTVLTTGGGAASNATDGNTSTYWRSTAHDVDYIYVDLGSSYDICKAAITWEASRYGKDFDLKVSDDGINWTIVHSTTGNTSTYSEFNGTFTGRYVGMFGKKQGTTLGYSVLEFQIFGAPASSCRAPSGLSAATTSQSSVHLSWDPDAGVSQYTINYHHYLSASWITRTTTTNSIDLNALSCGPLYYYTVQANCGANSSAVSNGSFTLAGCAATSCDYLPVRYFNLDLGDVGVAGSTCKNGNVWTLSGSGNDIGGTSDQFQFAYTNDDIVDYDVYARIVQQDQVSTNDKTGVMIRDSLTNTSRYAFIGSVNNGNSFIYEYRNSPNAPVTQVILPGHSFPYWVKLTKASTQYIAYTSADGVSWVSVMPAVDLNFGTDPTNAPHYGMAVTSANNSMLSTAQFDNFTVVSSTLLPIRLNSFNAKNINNDHVLISWSTAMEHLSDYFEILKSTNNKSFESIGSVKAKGESETTQNYALSDKSPATGSNFYQLKEFDKDGGFYLSPVVSVEFNEDQHLKIYPNPADNFTNIISEKDVILEARLFDITGKLIQVITANDGQNSVRLNTAALSKGVYIISVKTKTTTYRQKLFKE